jgi:DNA-binding CsgD family transcriptional regulator
VASSVGSERRRVRELAAHLDTFSPGAPPAFPALLPDFNRLLDAAATCAYSVGVDAQRLSVDWLHAEGISPRWVRELRALLEQTQFRPCAYTPVKPEPAQRNQPLMLDELNQLANRPSMPAPFKDFLSRAVHPKTDQLRVLVCDGPSLLAWVGAYRPRRFDGGDQGLLAALAPSLQRRLQLERHFEEATLTRAALETALEAITAPAFIVSGAIRVLHTNRAGRALLESERARTLASLQQLVTGGSNGLGTISELKMTGAPTHYLVLLRVPTGDLETRVRHAAQLFRLTPRQTEVLRLLAQGYANKSIAAILGCAVGTIEVHVTAVLHKAGVESRSELVAMFWAISP